MKVNKFLPSVRNSATALIGSSILAAGVLTLAAPVKAATMTCSAAVANKVTGTTGCEYSTSAEQDSLNTNPITVNAEQFFGFTDWVYSNKYENASLPDTKSGTWDISSVFQNTWDDVMLIFKSGNGTTLTGYLLQNGVTSGTWNSPFLETNNKGETKVKDVSHISVYYRTGSQQPTSVPEPASLAGLGVVGATIAMSRRKKAIKNA